MRPPDEPSALAEFSVRGLAGHLAGQVFFIPEMLAQPVPAEPVIPIGEYYAQVSWIGSDLDTPFNRSIRTGDEQDAAEARPRWPRRSPRASPICDRACCRG